MRKYITEFVGTFGLIFTIGVRSHRQGEPCPLAIAGVLTALVFAEGHISGAHYTLPSPWQFSCAGE